MQGIWRFRGSVYVKAICILLVFCAVAPSLATAAQGVDYNFGAERTAVSSQPKTSVDSFDGSFSYDFPLTLPPGRNGMEPSLSLSYSSKNTEQISPFGYGWAINIPYIERINKYGLNNLYSSSATSSFYSSLDGELQATSSATTTEWGALDENGSFNKYQYQNGYWTVTDKKGTIYKFGTSSLSQLVNSASSTQLYRWMLDEVRDRNGNYVKYEYQKDSNQIYPYKIKYTGNGTTDGLYEIEFARETRTDIATSSKTGFQVVSNYRIREIDIKVNGTLAKSYKIGFTTGSNGYRSLLRTLVEAGKAEVGGATSTMPTTTLQYSVEAPSWSLNSSWHMPEWFVDDTGSSTAPEGDMGTRFDDFNGDGLVDVLKARDNDGQTDALYINRDNGAWSTTTPIGVKPMVSTIEGTNARVADVNGDGRADFVNGWASTTINTSNGGSFVGSTTWTSKITYSATTSGVYYDDSGRILDFNGDGLADLARGYGSTTNLIAEAAKNGIYLNNGAGWNAAATSSPLLPVNSNPISYWKFDELSGNAKDIQGSNDLTNNGSTAYGPGKFSNANGIDFEKSSSTQYMQIADASQTGLDFSSKMSVCFWIKPESNPDPLDPSGGWWNLVNKDATSNRSFDFYYYPDGSGAYLLAFYAFSGDATHTNLHVTQNLGTGTFHYVCAAWDGSLSGATNKIKIYVDGTQNTSVVSSSDAGVTAMTNGTAPFRVGADGLAARYYVDGVIDELGVWNNTLTLTEISQLYNSGSGYPYGSATSTVWLLPSGKYFASTDTTTAGVDTGARFADFDGDGLTDIFYSRDGGSAPYNVFYFNNGDGTWTQTLPSGDISSTSPVFISGGVDTGYRLADVDSDGLVDIVYTRGSVYKNNGGGRFTIDSSWSASPEPFVCDGVTPTGCNYGDDAGGRFMDVNGDNVVDIVRSDGVDDHGTVNKTYLGSATAPVDLLTGITSNTIGSTTVTYKSTAAYRDTGGNALNPALPINFETVSAIATNSKIDTTIVATTTYTYAGGEYYYASPFDRKFAGFATTTVTDSYGNVTKTYSHQGNGTQSTLGEYGDSRSKIGKPYRVDIYSSTSTLYQTNITKWDSAALSNGRTFVFKTRDLQLDYDGNSTHRDKVNTYEYDSTNGNLLTNFNYGEVSGNDDGTFATGTAATIRTTRYTYIASSTPNIFGLPKSIVTFDSSSATTSEQRLYYDSLSLGNVDKGNLTKDERLATTTTYINNQYVYNSYGLPTSQTDPRNKTTSYTYNNNLFVATTTNAANQVIETFRDLSSGKVTKTIDPNGLAFETVYDGLDRPIEEKVPDHLGNASTSVTAVTYEYTTDAIGLYTVHQTNYLNSATSTEKYTYLDGLKRKIQERTEGESQYMVKDWEYDLRGQLKKESLPYFSIGTSRTSVTSSSSLLTSYSYDTLGRLATTTNVTGTATTTYDQWVQTSIDKNGKIKDYVYDAFGNLTAVGERKSGGTATTTYAYDALNNLSTTTDASSNIRTFNYDKLARLLKATDLHTTADTGYGVRTYVYDAAGNLATSTDSKSQTVEYLYDDLNRVLSENFTGAAGTEVQYSYDTCKWGKGRLCAATTTESVTRTDYDAIGNIATSTKIINNATSTTLFAYDRSKNITKVTYPNNIRANYDFNSAGLLESLWLLTGTTSATTIIASSTDYGPTGQAITRSLGNGYTSIYSYDSSNLYRLTNLTTSPGIATTTTTSETQGLISWWTFNNTANDSHTSGNNLTFSGGATTTSGLLGQALSVGGSSQYASINDAAQAGLDITSNFSIALWVKANSTPAISRLVTKFDSSLGTNAGYAFRMGTGATGLCGDLSSTGVGVSSYCVNWTPSTGTWYFLTMTFDGGRQELKFYANGSQVGSTQSTSESTIYDNSAPFCIAQMQGCADVFGVDGLIDEVGIWSGRVLTVTEISNLYNSGTGKTYSNLSTTSPSVVAGGVPIQNLSYTYDNVGNITAITDNSIGGTGRRTTFTYDDLHRMTNASTTAASSTPFTQTYAYDSLGNITSGPLGSYSYAGTGYANPHAATTINGVTYTYDNNGNLATSSPNVYYWDYRDRLTKSSNGTATTTYAYDENNSRIRRTILGTATTTYPSAYYNYSSTGSTTSHILLPDGTPIATVEAKNGAATSTYWLHLDHLGSVNQITNASSTLVQTLDYYPFGDQRISSSSGAISEQKQYIGKDYDSDSDLNYLEARYYSGEKGRFLSQDPIFNSLPKLQNLRNPQSLNSYSYADNNPIVNKDPTGKSAQSVIRNTVQSVLKKFNLSSFFSSFLSNFSSSPKVAGAQTEVGQPKISTPINYSAYNERFAETQRKIVGSPYEESSPRSNGPDFFDCSGAVIYGIRQMSNPNFKDHTANDLYHNYSIPSDSRGPGTVTFYDYSGTGHVDHVTTNVGDNKMVNPLNPSTGVLKTSTTYMDNYTLSGGGKIYHAQLNWDTINQ